eukprot:c8822_g1_i3.p1 GENE.c8822_g1_i3~~c8822_g1_i3.p1  ORF type:complete len:189 (+),score=40.77 c8822_g1_i3:231-797(+)
MASNPALAAWYFEQLESVAAKFGHEVSKSVRRCYCEMCHIPLVSGWSASTRTKHLSRKKYGRSGPDTKQTRFANTLIVKCHVCGQRNSELTSTTSALNQIRSHHKAISSTTKSDIEPFFVDKKPDKRTVSATVTNASTPLLPASPRTPTDKRKGRQLLQKVLESQDKRISSVVPSQPSRLKDFLQSLK